MNIIQNINEINDYTNTINDIDIKDNKKRGNFNINIPNNIQKDQLNQMTIIYNINKKKIQLRYFEKILLKII